MKQLILFLLLFCSITFGQSGKSVWSQALEDSTRQAIADSLQTERNKQGFVNIKNFAPKGTATDGTVDWTSYFNSALLSSSKIYFPGGSQNDAGIYRVSLNISQNGVQIIGDGGSRQSNGWSTRFLPAKNQDTLISVSAQECRIQNIFFDGYDGGTGYYADYGIHCSYVNNLEVSNSSFIEFNQGTASTAIKSGSWSSKFENIVISDIDIGINIDSTQHVIMDNVKIGYAYVAHIKGRKGTDVVVKDSDFSNPLLSATTTPYSYTTKFIQLDRPLRWVFEDNYCEPADTISMRAFYFYDSTSSSTQSNIIIRGGAYGYQSAANAIDVYGYPFYISLENVRLNFNTYPISIEDSLDSNNNRLNIVNMLSCRLIDGSGRLSVSTIYGYTNNVWDLVKTNNLYSNAVIFNTKNTMPEYGYFNGIYTSGAGIDSTKRNVYGLRIPTYNSVQANDTISVTIHFNKRQINSSASYRAFMDASIKLRWGTGNNQAASIFKIHCYQGDDGTSANLREITVTDTLGATLLSTNLPESFNWVSSTDSTFTFEIAAKSTLAGTFEIDMEVTEGTNVKTITISEH